MAVRGSSKLTPLPALALLLVVMGGFGLMRERKASDTAPICAEGSTPDCAPSESEVTASRQSPSPVLDAATACRDVGYLCAELGTTDRIHVRRWKDFSGTLVVHVPRPDFETSGDGARLQQAAARGVRAWNGQPFAILADLRGDREAHFEVRWSRGLSGPQIGVARTQWSGRSGLSVLAIELTTRNPFNPGSLNATRQVQLTAAHEMGHALGLPHSDSERDVMYPTNTASSLSAQDYRTMEALYSLEDGTEIVR